MGIVWFGALGQLLFYALALLDLGGKSILARVARVARTFTVLNWAAVIGLLRYILKDFRWKS